MGFTHIEESVNTSAAAFDTLARLLHGRFPRRRAAGLLVAALATSVFRFSANAENAAAVRATSIPPNCIFVCCDGTCDSWTMCMRCVKWPKPPTTGTVVSR